MFTIWFHEIFSQVPDEDDRYEKLCHFNPILIPIILGWKRQITKHRNAGKRSVYYIGPCGRRLRNLVSSTQCRKFSNFYAIQILRETKVDPKIHWIPQWVAHSMENIAIFLPFTVWENEKFSHQKIFRQINSLVKPLLSRNFAKIDVRCILCLNWHQSH